MTLGVERGITDLVFSRARGTDLGTAMSSETELLKHLYDRFNARDMEAVPATMTAGRHLGQRAGGRACLRT
jgi:hypothetical protein